MKQPIFGSALALAAVMLAALALIPLATARIDRQAASGRACSGSSPQRRASSIASTRSNRTSPSGATAPSAQTPSEAVTAIARESTRIQLAALSAVENALAGWAQAADRLAHAVGDELLRRVDAETNSRQLFVSVAAATGAHLHDVAALPRAAVNHLDARVARAPANS
jgi:hypothetical protein